MRKKKKSSFPSKRGQDQDRSVGAHQGCEQSTRRPLFVNKMLSELLLNIKLHRPGKFKYKRNMKKVIYKLSQSHYGHGQTTKDRQDHDQPFGGYQGHDHSIRATVLISAVINQKKYYWGYNQSN